MKMIPITRCILQIVVFIAFLGAVVGCQSPAPSAATKEKMLDDVSKNYTHAWCDFIDQHVAHGKSLDQVLSTMCPLSRDWGYIPLGGSGACTYVFVIDDFSEVRVDFDVAGKSMLATLTDRRGEGVWRKMPNRIIIECETAVDE